MQDVVTRIREEYIIEALNSPILFGDLSKMEKYIAESYDGRSLIELLQNADDAGATKFRIQKINDTAFAVANNGRLFTELDLQSLCRSGASKKKRGQNTIGYRGIGFKSVVNYAQSVHVISGDMRFTFSREKTSNLLGAIDGVPLIRVPHNFSDSQFDGIINQLLKNSLTTIFIFETFNSKIEQEMESFNNTCMLFLRNIENVTLQYNDIQTINVAIRSNESKDRVVTQLSNQDGDNSTWITLGNPPINSIAFKYDSLNKQITLAQPEESYIHCFMPTTERFLLPCKINGDFSTDPSRTRIVIDEYTKESLSSIVHMLTKQVVQAIKNEDDPLKLVKVLSQIQVSPISKFVGRKMNDEFVDILREKLTESIRLNYGQNTLYLQPEWLTKDDLKVITIKDAYLISCDTLDKIDGLRTLLAFIGVKDLDIDIILPFSLNHTLSPMARINILKQLILKYRFNLSEQRKRIISDALIIQGQNGVCSLGQIRNSEKINPNYIMELETMLGNIDDVRGFLMKFNINTDICGKQINNVKTIDIPKSPITKAFGRQTIFSKWRSAEVNAKLLLQEQDDIIDVEDVSKRNIGYDLIATMKDGSMQFFEVKSVNKLGDEFTLTNNEYLTALDSPTQYNLMIIQQDDVELNACIINNPLHALSLTKRIRSYEWLCEAYTGELLKRDLRP